VTKNQINVNCLKCKNNKFNTLSLEFQFHGKDSKQEPKDITINKRGSACHGLHYLTTHGYLVECKIIGNESTSGAAAALSLDNRPLLSDEAGQIQEERQEIRARITEFVEIDEKERSTPTESVVIESIDATNDN